MATSSLARSEALAERISTTALRSVISDLPKAPSLVLATFDLIGEVKWRSPSEGRLGRSPQDLVESTVDRVRAYAKAGVAAISVLTEPERFGGSMSLLSHSAAISPVPVMRKDFLVRPNQVLEARAAGAGGVLLIAKILDDATLSEMLSVADELGLFVLLEAFDEVDLARIGQTHRPGKVLVGLNTRDLVSLAVDTGRLSALRDAMPTDCVTVAESGMYSADDVGKSAELGYDLALVGSALMGREDPSDLIHDMLRQGRACRCL